MTAADAVTGPSPLRDHELEFRGSGGEYFRIWISGLLLSLLTLGLYSPWATVRNRRYLHRSTHLMGSAFDYHATGAQLLRGRVAAVAVVVAYVAVGHWAPAAQPVVLLGAVALLPWVIVQARAFGTHSVSWRNVRFGFEPAYGQAYAIYLLWPLTIPLTLGLTWPYLLFRQQRFLVNNTRFGREPFRLRGRPDLYFLLVFGLVFAGALATGVLVAALAWIAAGVADASALPAGGWALLVAGGLGIGVTLHTVYRTFVLNDVCNHTRLGHASFTLRLRVGRMLWIRLTNAVLIVLTLGLFTPWAQVRMRRYVLARASVTVSEAQVRRLKAAAGATHRASGDELAGAFDLDVGIA